METDLFRTRLSAFFKDNGMTYLGINLNLANFQKRDPAKKHQLRIVEQMEVANPMHCPRNRTLGFEISQGALFNAKVKENFKQLELRQNSGL